MSTTSMWPLNETSRTVERGRSSYMTEPLCGNRCTRGARLRKTTCRARPRSRWAGVLKRVGRPVRRFACLMRVTPPFWGAAATPPAPDSWRRVLEEPPIRLECGERIELLTQTTGCHLGEHGILDREQVRSRLVGEVVLGGVVDTAVGPQVFPRARGGIRHAWAIISGSSARCLERR